MRRQSSKLNEINLWLIFTSSSREILEFFIANSSSRDKYSSFSSTSQIQIERARKRIRRKINIPTDQRKKQMLCIIFQSTWIGGSLSTNGEKYSRNDEQIIIESLSLRVGWIVSSPWTLERWKILRHLSSEERWEHRGLQLNSSNWSLWMIRMMRIPTISYDWRYECGRERWEERHETWKITASATDTMLFSLSTIRTINQSIFLTVIYRLSISIVW